MVRSASATSCSNSTSPSVKPFCQSVPLVTLIVLPPGIAAAAPAATRISGIRSKKKPTSPCHTTLGTTRVFWKSAIHAKNIPEIQFDCNTLRCSPRPVCHDYLRKRTRQNGAGFWRFKESPVGKRDRSHRRTEKCLEFRLLCDLGLASRDDRKESW